MTALLESTKSVLQDYHSVLHGDQVAWGRVAKMNDVNKLLEMRIVIEEGIASFVTAAGLLISF